MDDYSSCTDKASSISSLQGSVDGKNSKYGKSSSNHIHKSFLLPSIFPRNADSSERLISEPPKEISITPKADVLLRPLQVVLAAAVIQECIEKLEIFMSRYPNVKSSFDFKAVHNRFQSCQYPSKNIVIMQNKDKATHWKRKLAMDVSLLQKGLRIAKADLAYDDHIVFHYYLRNELWKWKTEYNLRQLHGELSNAMSAMRDTSELLRKAGERAKKQSQISFLNMQELLEESSFKFGAAIEYVKKFNACRVEQNRLFIELQEKKILEEATNKSSESEHEKKVHQNIMKFYKRAIENLEAEIQQWRLKYAKDMEEMEYKTYSLVTDTSRQAAKLAEILALYSLREMQIEAYSDKKEELFYLETTEYAMDTLYTAIQSWWRGTIVRWELVPSEAEKKKKKQIKQKK